jgi:hypothetical protein
LRNDAQIVFEGGIVNFGVGHLKEQFAKPGNEGHAYGLRPRLSMQ